MKNLHSIPKTIYDLLPSLLQEVTHPFQNLSRERDVVLLSALVALSGCFPSVSGLYDSVQVHANLYGLLFAPPASGKGRARFAIALVQEIQAALNRKNKEALQRYLLQKKAVKEGTETEGGVVSLKDLAPPEQRKYLLPANISATALIKHIKENEDTGNLIYDSETDALGSILENEWASGISELLRKGFHHERTSIARSTNNLLLEIEAPKISLLLTGTPGQLSGILKSVEDGLFSRCLFYVFDTTPRWKNVAPNAETQNLEGEFKQLAQKVFAIHQYFTPTTYHFELTPLQWQRFNTHFEERLGQIVAEEGSATQSSVKRMGLICYRCAMLFSILDHYEEQQTTQVITCSDKSLEASIALSNYFLQHTVFAYRQLSKTKVKSEDRSVKGRFLAAIPAGIVKRKDLLDISKRLGISHRSMGYYVKQALENGQLHQLKHGHYSKTVPDGEVQKMQQ